MKTVREILDDKGRDVLTINPEATVHEALSKMADKDIGALIVTFEGGVAGVISERDYARKVALLGKCSLDTMVQDIMSRQTVCVDPDDTVKECMTTMTDQRVRHLPVLEAGALVGILSIGDVVKSIICDCESKVDELENMIYGQ